MELKTRIVRLLITSFEYCVSTCCSSTLSNFPNKITGFGVRLNCYCWYCVSTSAETHSLLCSIWLQSVLSFDFLCSQLCPIVGFDNSGWIFQVGIEMQISNAQNSVCMCTSKINTNYPRIVIVDRFYTFPISLLSSALYYFVCLFWFIWGFLFKFCC